MGKKIIYFLIVVLIGGFIVMQSCNESPIVSNEPQEGSFYDFEKMEANGITTVNFFGDWDKPGYPINCSDNEQIKLWAKTQTNEYIHVGYIEYYCIPNSYNKIKVKFKFINPNNGPFPWTIKKICFNMESSLSNFPRKSGGAPNVDAFDVHQTFSAPDYFTGNEWIIPQYTLPHDWWWGDASRCDDYYVMAFVEICYTGGAEGFGIYLSDSLVTYNVQHNSPDSYFKVNIVSGGGLLNGGPYESFCVDADLNIYPPQTLTGHIYTSTGTLPPGCLGTAIENWSNMDLVNWIMNEYPVGSSVPQYSYSILPTVEQGYPFAGTFTTLGTNGTVTWQDLQAAIWALLEGGEPLSVAWGYLQPQSALNQTNVWGIVNAALTNTEADGFTPDCEDIITAILCPDGGNVQIITIQPTIMQFSLPCETICYNVWGDGKCGADFPNYSGWATYFKWNPSCY
jgi:hypothetical protein